MKESTKERESYIFYKSFNDAIEELEDEVEKYKLHNAIANFNLYNIEPKFPKGTLTMAWKLIRPQLVANKKKFINGCKPKINYKNKRTNNTKKTEKSQKTVEIDGEEYEEVTQ